jgi:hypothetical protein
MRVSNFVAATAALLALTGCKTANSAADAVQSAGSAVANGVSDAASGAVSLVNVNLSNVLNNLALDLHVDKANIPINAQIPISIAANVCGVSINILSIGGGSSSQGCTANSISPELKQYIQQQLAANGSVGGGDQTTTPTNTQSPTGTTTTTSPTSTPTTTTPTTGSSTDVQKPAPCCK